jgi:bacterioferritin-associated ferredoxin
MTHVFIFVKDIENALKKGRTEIELPEGARVSSAALDLIKERRLKINYVSPENQSADESSAESDENAASTLSETSDAKETPEPEKGKVVSEEEVEEIARRVIERFRQVKKSEPGVSQDRDSQEADDDDLIICRCEEITKGEIKEAIRNGMKTLNGIKRVTRAGMGLCQGQTCQRLVSQILASELGVPPGKLEPTTARAPVRPLKLSVFATG